MKRIALFLVFFALGSSVTVVAKNKENTTTTTVYNNAPISFIERGIVFYIFPNGEFDFNTHPNIPRNVTYGAPRPRAYHYDYYPPRKRIIIEHDYQGRVRRVGNVFINYDNNNRVKRIGSVYLRYNRFALVQIGGLYIKYNHYGKITATRGSIKPRLPHYHYPYFDSNDDFDDDDFDDDDFDDDDFDDDFDDGYYYKGKGKRKASQKEKVKKERKE